MTVSDTPPGRVKLNLQAATDRALSVLLADLGLTVLGPDGAPSAHGVLSMRLGGATLDGGNVPIAGRFAFVFVDREKFGADETDALVLAAEPHRWKGEPIAYLMGEEALYDPASHVPQSVPMAEARKAMLASGKFGATAEAVDTAVRAAFAGLQEPMKSQALIDWEFQPSVRRHTAFTLAAAAVFKLTEADLDALFIAARGA